jgi:hypothetical protein
LKVPGVELVAYRVDLFTPPMKKLPWSLRFSGPDVKAPSLALPIACAEALPAVTATRAAAAKPQLTCRVKPVPFPMELSLRFAGV